MKEIKLTIEATIPVTGDAVALADAIHEANGLKEALLSEIGRRGGDAKANLRVQSPRKAKAEQVDLEEAIAANTEARRSVAQPAAAPAPVAPQPPAQPAPSPVKGDDPGPVPSFLDRAKTPPKATEGQAA